jgi:hypothetical protein
MEGLRIKKESFYRTASLWTGIRTPNKRQKRQLLTNDTAEELLPYKLDPWYYKTFRAILHQRKRKLGRPKHRLEYNIKMYLRESGWDVVNCIHLAQDTDQ